MIKHVWGGIPPLDDPVGPQVSADLCPLCLLGRGSPIRIEIRSVGHAL